MIEKIQNTNNDNRHILLIDYVIFANDLEADLRERGYTVKKLLVSVLNVERFMNICRNFKPSMVVSVNFSPEMAMLTTVQNIPYISWTVDPLPLARFKLIKGTKTELCTAFVHRKKICDTFKAVGINHTFYLPLAAPGKRRIPVTDPALLNGYHCNISFVGNSLTKELDTLNAYLKSNHWDDNELTLFNEHLNIYFTNVGDGNSFEGIDAEFPHLPEPFREKLLKCPKQAYLKDLLNGALSCLLRMGRVKTLQEKNIHVYGDKGWQSLGNSYKGFANHGDELTAIYCASTINLDLPRIYQRDILTMRIFDILACGGIMLTEQSAGLSDIFSDGTHLMSYTDSKDMMQKTEHLLQDKALRESISLQGKNEVLKHHLISHRIDTILEEYRKRYS